MDGVKVGNSENITEPVQAEVGSDSIQPYKIDRYMWSDGKIDLQLLVRDEVDYKFKSDIDRCLFPDLDPDGWQQYMRRLNG